MNNKEEELDNGLTEEGLIDFIKTVLLSGDSPRGDEAERNLEWGIKQYRKHLKLYGVLKPLKDVEEIVFDDWRKQHKFKITEHGYYKNGIHYMVNEVTSMYVQDLYNL